MFSSNFNFILAFALLAIVSAAPLAKQARAVASPEVVDVTNIVWPGEMDRRAVAAPEVIQRHQVVDVNNFFWPGEMDRRAVAAPEKQTVDERNVLWAPVKRTTTTPEAVDDANRLELWMPDSKRSVATSDIGEPAGNFFAGRH
ncbi:hypothetical protein C8J57DRAFT_1461676 [Mycena rebaudengoi]|nr:hypothetical protein C8J57DRAFT_1461676 [Mycena rebaudengoi]